jgi:hypothetical protein
MKMINVIFGVHMAKTVSSNHNHLHDSIANHSLEQQRMFFALAQTLGYDKNLVKERAKKHFKKECFNELSKSELMWLIDKLVTKVYK